MSEPTTTYLDYIIEREICVYAMDIVVLAVVA